MQIVNNKLCHVFFNIFYIKKYYKEILLYFKEILPFLFMTDKYASY